MSGCIKDSCSSLSHTMKSFTQGECFENFDKMNTSNKLKAVIIPLVAAVGVGVLLGFIPVVGPVIAVPFALLVGLYAFARLTQPKDDFFDKVKGKLGIDNGMEGMKCSKICKRMCSFDSFREFMKLPPKQKAAVVISAVVAALCVGILIGGALTSAPVLGGLVAFGASVLVGLTVFTYLSSTLTPWTRKADHAAQDAAASVLGIRKPGIFDALTTSNA